MKTTKLTDKEFNYLLHIVDSWYVDESNDRTQGEINKEKKLLNILVDKLRFKTQ